MQLSVDAIDTQAGVVLTMTPLAAEIRALPILEDNDFLGTELIHNCEADRCALDKRLADHCAVVIANQQDIVDIKLMIDFERQPLDIDGLPDLGAILAAPRPENCIHRFLQSSLVSTAVPVSSLADTKHAGKIGSGG
jgi:hypothetical protein